VDVAAPQHARAMKGTWLLLSMAVRCVAAEASPQFEARMEVDVFRVPQELGLREIPRLNDPARASESLESLELAVSQGKAKRTHTLTARSTSNVVASARQFEEVRYPIEYEWGDPSLLPAAPGKSGEKPATGYPGTCYEARNCGINFSGLPIVHPDGKFVTLQMSLNVTRFDRWHRQETGTRANGVTMFIQTPVLERHDTSSVAVLRVGTPALVGCYKAGDSSDFELHVVKVVAKRLSADLADAAKKLAPRENESFQYWAEQFSAAAHPEPHPLTSPPIRFECLKVRMATTDALPFRRRFVDSQQAQAAIKELMLQVRRGKAELMTWHVVQSSAGSRAVTNDVHEIKMSIEPDRRYPYTPQIVYEPETRSLSHSNTPFDPPNTFQTEDVGHQLEIHGLTSDGTAVDVDYAIRTRSQRGFSRWPSGPDRWGRMSFVYLPQLFFRKTSSSAVLQNAQWRLCGFQKLQDKPQCELVLLKATVDLLGKETQKR
jgi:hypothetical protein